MLKKVLSLFQDTPHKDAEDLYAMIVAQARQPAFYTHYGVPDTVDGRFEMIVLHMCLLSHRLQGGQPAKAPTTPLGQSIFDLFIKDMDACLRELGAGDMGVGHRIKAMAQGYYGRTANYSECFEDRQQDLPAAIKKNVYGTCTQDKAKELSKYCLKSIEHLQEIKLDTVINIKVLFPSVEIK